MRFFDPKPNFLALIGQLFSFGHNYLEKPTAMCAGRRQKEVSMASVCVSGPWAHYAGPRRGSSILGSLGLLTFLLDLSFLPPRPLTYSIQKQPQE